MTLRLESKIRLEGSCPATHCRLADPRSRWLDSGCSRHETSQVFTVNDIIEDVVSINRGLALLELIYALFMITVLSWRGQLAVLRCDLLTLQPNVIF